MRNEYGQKKDQDTINIMERMLEKQFVEEVEKEIKAMVMPKIEANIKQFAKNAVEKWSITTAHQMKMQDFGPIHEVMIKFTENIIHKYPTPDLSTKIKEVKWNKKQIWYSQIKKN